MKFHLTLLLLIASASALAASPTTKTPLPKATPKAQHQAPLSSAPQAENAAPESKVVWDAWYTVTVNGKIPYSYYNDRVEIRNGRLFFQNRVWKREEDYINEEQLGAFAENNPDLTPLFYNFHSTYRSSEINIDGNVKDGKMLSVKIRKGAQELPIVKKSLASRTFFSSFFPVWVAQKLSSFVPGKTMTFLAVQEDDPDMNFSTLSGHIRLEKPDEFAQKTNTTKLSVEFRGAPSFWWVDASGVASRIEMKRQNITVERVPREMAQKFLDK